MAIAYIYYANEMNTVGVYLWEPEQPSEKYTLRPYRDNQYACKTVLIDFEKSVCVIRKNGCIYESPLRDPTADKVNLKHQAHFDFDPVDWRDWAGDD